MDRLYQKNVCVLNQYFSD